MTWAVLTKRYRKLEIDGRCIASILWVGPKRYRCRIYGTTTVETFHPTLRDATEWMTEEVCAAS